VSAAVVRSHSLPAGGLAPGTRVLVLDGNENQAVASVRSLAAAGCEVHVGADTAWSKAGWSRFAHRRFTYASPQQSAAAFLASILAEIRRVRGALVLPMTERSTLPLSEHRDEVTAAGGRLVLPAHASVLKAFDKEQTTELARSLGIPVPTTTCLGDYVDARQLALKTRYPVVLKPRSSEEIGFSGRTRSTGAPVYARNPHEFMVAYRTLARRCRTILVQEYVEGAGVGYFALMRHGDLRAEFAHRRLRDVRPTGSGSSLRVSIAVDSRMRAHALRLLEALQWHGVAMVEFRRRPDGTPVLLEVNGRFWNSLALAVRAGVDFPRLLAQMESRGDVGPLPAYEAGVHCRWTLGDVRHLVEVLQGPPAGFPGRFPGRLAALAAFLRPVPGTYHDNFSLDDPLPELGDWLDFALRKVPGLRRRHRDHHRKELHVERRYSHP
jgi:predicted ATP-grasp superfamily ATP-dependent carboligase